MLLSESRKWVCAGGVIARILYLERRWALPWECRLIPLAGIYAI